MRAISLLPACLLLAGSLTAQQYDAAGNDPTFVSGPGSSAPGSVLATVTGPYGPSSDLCHDGENLLVCSAYDGVGRIYHVNESTGATVATTPIGTTSDFGLAWDDQREIFVTSDPSADVLQGWSRAGAPLFSYAFPGTGLVGVGWDCMRDVYWVCDWTTEQVYAVNPATGAIGFGFGVAFSGCTRVAGLAFDPVADVIYVGGRDTNRIYGFNPATGGLVCSFAAQDGSNNPQGCAMSMRGGVWHSSWNSSRLYELESCTPVHPWLLIAPNFPTAGSPVTLTMSGLGAGHTAVIAYSLSGCGPMSSPLGTMLLSPPAKVLVMAPANGAGVYATTKTIPSGLAGRSIYLHGGNATAVQRCNNAILHP